MFCDRCGREIKDGEMFCPGCGTPVGGSPTNAQTNAPVNSSVYVQPERRKKLSTGAVVAIVVSAAVVVIALVVLYFLFWHKGGNSSQPFQTEQLKMTINGENIPVVHSGFAYCEEGCGVVFIGKKGTKLYRVLALFLTEKDPNCPSSNATYNSLNGRYADYVGVAFSYMDSSKEVDVSIHTFSSPSWFNRAQVSVGEYKPNQKLELSITGIVSNDGVSFDFSASGSPEFYNDFDELTNKMDSIIMSF